MRDSDSDPEESRLDSQKGRFDFDVVEAVGIALDGDVFAAKRLLLEFVLNFRQGQEQPPALQEYLCDAFKEILDFDTPPDKALNLRRGKGRPRGGGEGGNTEHLLMGLFFISLRQKGSTHQEAALQVAEKTNASQKTVERAFSHCRELALFFRETGFKPIDPSEYSKLEDRGKRLTESAESIPEPDLKDFACARAEVFRHRVEMDRIKAEAWAEVYKNMDYLLR